MFDTTRDFFERKLYKNPYILKQKTKSFFIKLFMFLFIVGLSYLFLLGFAFFSVRNIFVAYIFFFPILKDFESYSRK